jgi:hypothetical protein
MVVTNPKISEDDCRRLLLLFEMIQRASREGADAHTQNEGRNAMTALFRLLAKYGLDFDDIPDLKRQHEQVGAAKTAKPTAAAPKTPNVLELTIHVLQEWFDVQAHEYVAIALWTLHAHRYDSFQISPRLLLSSIKAGCGKSIVLKILARLVPNPERHDNITAASIYRIIERGASTLLLDEGDNLGLEIDRVMRSVLNSGYMRDGVATRTIRNEVKSFPTYAPMAAAAIGPFPLPLMSRALFIRMHPTLRDDLKIIEMLNDPKEAQRLDALNRYIAAWAQTVQLDLNPPLPKILRNRTANNWRVLLSIADSFGSVHWSRIARDTAVEFADGFHDEDAIVALLFDIRLIFRRLNVDRIKSAALIEELRVLEDGAGIWSAWSGTRGGQAPHPITQGEIAALLRNLGDRELRPRTVFELGSRESRGSSGQGYHKQPFEKWWAIYCPEKGGEGRADNVRKLRTSE